jgi:hypothetical protein
MSIRDIITTCLSAAVPALLAIGCESSTTNNPGTGSDSYSDGNSDGDSDTDTDGDTDTDAVDAGDGDGTLLVSYGAECDGVSDDREAIQSAFHDVANWADGSLIFPPDGTCIISGRVSLNGNAWSIEGRNATIKAKDGMCLDGCGPMLLFSNVRDFSIHRLHIDGNRATRQPAEKWNGHNVVFQNAKDGLIENVEWKNAATDNAYISAEVPSDTGTFSSGLVFANGVFSNAFRNNVSVIEGWNVAFQGTCSGGVSGSCTCQFIGANGTAPEAGIDWEPNPGSAAPGIDNGLMDGCLFANNHGSGAMMSDIGGARNVTLRNSIIRNNGQSTTTPMKDAITILAAGILIENNWIGQPAGMRFAVIYVGGGRQSNLRTTQIRNNLIQGQPTVASDTGKRHVVLFGNFGDDTASFTDNTMTDIGVSASGDWCEDWKNHSSNISSNTIDGTAQSPDPGCP